MTTKRGEYSVSVSVRHYKVRGGGPGAKPLRVEFREVEILMEGNPIALVYGSAREALAKAREIVRILNAAKRVRS